MGKAARDCRLELEKQLSVDLDGCYESETLLIYYSKADRDPIVSIISQRVLEREISPVKSLFSLFSVETPWILNLYNMVEKSVF